MAFFPTTVEMFDRPLSLMPYRPDLYLLSSPILSSSVCLQLARNFPLLSFASLLPLLLTEQQQYMDLLSLDKRLQKLKLYLEHLTSSLVRLRPQYDNLMLQSAEPWIEEYKPSCRGLLFNGRAFKRVVQKLLVFFMIILFIVTWANFIRPDRLPFASRRPEPYSPIFNTTLGVCLRTTNLYENKTADNDTSFRKCTH